MPVTSNNPGIDGKDNLNQVINQNKTESDENIKEDHVNDNLHNFIPNPNHVKQTEPSHVKYNHHYDNDYKTREVLDDVKNEEMSIGNTTVPDAYINLRRRKRSLQNFKFQKALSFFSD